MENLTPVFKVSELNSNIKQVLEGSFSDIWVEGEISGFKEYPSGHMYFDLKDEKSLIACVFFKWFASKLKFNPENGLLVKVYASVGIYDKQSKYQLQVKDLISLKHGPLQLAFEQLKEKLKKEGLFDEAGKKKIPKFPSRVALVTSSAGAALRDMLSVLKRRFSGIEIIIYPVKVQGEGAKEEIAEAIKDLNEHFPNIDVMLVGRGGGSIEDLWAFNEELVARAIYASKIPVISCVGHETDFTIADFVADLRAPTPSAAAEIVAANKKDIIRHLSQVEKRLLQSLRINYAKMSSKFLRIISSKVFKDPHTIIEDKYRFLDEALESARLNMDKKFSSFEAEVRLNSEKLKNLSPYFPLKKGYAIIKKNGIAVKKAADLKKQDLINLVFDKDLALCEVKEIEKGEKNEQEK